MLDLVRKHGGGTGVALMSGQGAELAVNDAPPPAQGARDRSIRMKRKVEQLKRKVAEMRQLLTQAKGVRWMLMLMIGAGAVVAAKVAPLVQFTLGL